MAVEPKWTGGLSPLGPMFRDLDDALRGRLPRSWPDPAALDAGLGGAARTWSGHRIRFIAATEHRAGALAYERAVYERGEVPTRPYCWHDLFNAICWHLFPHTKAALNRGHWEDDAPPPRSRRRDALTLIDEAALVLAVSDPIFEALNRAHRWRDLFVERRAAWGRSIQAVPLGHGLLEQCLAPHRGLTAKAVYVAVPPGFFALPAARRIALLDSWLAPRIRTVGSPRELLPLPVLGIPGWHGANADPAYYDDEGYFRPKRG